MFLYFQNRFQHGNEDIRMELTPIKTDHGRSLVFIQNNILRRKSCQRECGNIRHALITSASAILLHESPYVFCLQDVRHDVYNVKLRFGLIIIRHEFLLQIQLDFIRNLIILRRFVDDRHLTLLVRRNGKLILNYIYPFFFRTLLLRLGFLFRFLGLVLFDTVEVIYCGLEVADCAVKMLRSLLRLIRSLMKLGQHCFVNFTLRTLLSTGCRLLLYAIHPLYFFSYRRGGK